MKHLKRIVIIALLVLGINSAFSAQDSSVLLEKGIYTEETLGSLPEAIAIYQKVMAATETSRATSAAALFRIGMCYQKMNRPAEAQAAFGKLAKQYPEQQELIARIPGAASKKSAPRRVPWVDGEELQYVDKDGDTNAIYRTTSVQINGKAAWNFQTLSVRKDFFRADIPNYPYSRIYMDASNLLPINSSYSTYRDIYRVNSGIFTLGTVQINYTPGVIEVSGNGKKLKALDVEAYDSNSDQFEAILRTLPLREGFQTVIPMLSRSWAIGSSDQTSSLIENIKVSVPVREKVAVPAGIYECYKVVKSLSSGSAVVFWISADEHAYIVKIDGRDGGNRELKSIRKIDKNRPVSFDESELGIRISAPASWYILRCPRAPKIYLIEPDSGVVGILSISDNTSLSPEDLLNKAIESNKRGDLNRKYQFRAESKMNTSISGVQAISGISDVDTGFDKLVEFVCFFIKSNKTYQLIIQVDVSKFSDSMKSALDSIANSIVIR
jgi:hypothetical protein